MSTAILGQEALNHHANHPQTSRETSGKSGLILSSHEQLLQLDSATSYTALSNPLIKHLLSNRNIAPCLGLWLLIRVEQSGFSDREYITRTVTWLANQLGVSRITVQQWQRKLEQAGYLEIIRHPQKNNRHLPSEYRASVPLAVFKQLMQEKKRVKLQVVESQPIEQPVTTETEEMPAVSRENPAAEPSFPGNEEPEPIQINEVAPPVEQLDNQPLLSVLEQDKDLPDWLSTLLPALKFEMDKANHTLWINNVPSFAFKPLAGKKALLSSVLNQKKQIFIWLKFNRNEHISRETGKISREKQNLTSKTSHQTIDTQPIQQTNTLSPHTRFRLLQRIKGTTINGSSIGDEQANQLHREVIYAIQKGSLAKFGALHASNIALKLIRENRWQTPAHFSGKF